MEIPYKLLPSSSSTENTKGKSRQPGTHLDDDDEEDPDFQLITFTMFMFFTLSACQLLTEPELLENQLGGWHDVIIDAIAFLYSMVMIHLLLIKRRNKKQMQREIAGKGSTSAPTCGTLLMSILMLVATGIMLVALGVAVSVFRPSWLDLGLVALWVLLSTASMFFLLKVEEVERKKRLRAKSEDVSNQV